MKVRILKVKKFETSYSPFFFAKKIIKFNFFIFSVIDTQKIFHSKQILQTMFQNFITLRRVSPSAKMPTKAFRAMNFEIFPHADFLILDYIFPSSENTFHDDSSSPCDPTTLRNIVYVAKYRRWNSPPIHAHEIFHARTHVRGLNVLFILLHALHHMIESIFFLLSVNPSRIAHAGMGLSFPVAVRVLVSTGRLFPTCAALHSLFSAFRVDGWQGKVLVRNFLSFLLSLRVKSFSFARNNRWRLIEKWKVAWVTLSLAVN